jgi:hypothetical protein
VLGGDFEHGCQERLMHSSRLRGELPCLGLLLSLLSTLCHAGGQSSFELGFEGPSSITGDYGTIVETIYYVTLRGSHSDPASVPHANAWNLSLRSSGGEIVDINVDRTWGEVARSLGVVRDDVIKAKVDGGAVLQVVYSVEDSESLPVATQQRIAAIVVAVPIVNGLPLQLDFQDGLRGSFGAVDNLIEEDGRVVTAKLTPKRVEISSLKNYTPSVFGLRFDGPFALEDEPGRKVKGDFRCLLDSFGRADALVDAWSLGVIARGGSIVGISVRGTDAEQALATGFVRNEVTSSTIRSDHSIARRCPQLGQSPLRTAPPTNGTGHRRSPRRCL